MTTLWFDCETYSECDLKTHATPRYAEHPSTEITVAQWAVDDGEPVVVDCTRSLRGAVNGELYDLLFDDSVIVIAHNAMFDRTLVRKCWGVDVPLERWQDTMIQAMAHGLPGGLDKVGQIVARAAIGLGMSVCVYDPFLPERRAKELGVELAELDALLARSDFITIHTPLTDKTRGLIGAAALADPHSMVQGHPLADHLGVDLVHVLIDVERVDGGGLRVLEHAAGEAGDPVPDGDGRDRHPVNFHRRLRASRAAQPTLGQLT